MSDMILIYSGTVSNLYKRPFENNLLNLFPI